MSRVVDCVGWSDGYVGRVGRLVGRIRRLGEKVGGSAVVGNVGLLV